MEIKYMGDFEEYLDIVRARTRMVEVLKKGLSKEEYETIEEKGFDSYSEELKQAELYSNVIRPEGYDIAIVPVGISRLSLTTGLDLFCKDPHNEHFKTDERIDKEIKNAYQYEFGNDLYSLYTQKGIKNTINEIKNGTAIVIPLPTGYASYDASDLDHALELELDRGIRHGEYPERDFKNCIAFSYSEKGRSNYYSDHKGSRSQERFRETHQKIINAENGTDSLKFFLDYYQRNASEGDVSNLDSALSKLGTSIESLKK